MIRMMIDVMNLLCPGPCRRVTLRAGELGTKLRTPLGFITGVKFTGIKRAEGVAADAAGVFEDEAQVRLKSQIRSDKDSTQGVRIVLEERFAIAAVVSGFQANMVGTG